MCKQLYLLRHGQSEWNVARRMQGRRESRLTDFGRAQARAMGAVLAREIADPSQLTAFTSPLERARDSAALALAPLGLVATPDARLQEIGLGAWEGLTAPEAYARFPWAEGPRRADPFRWHFMAPGGETLAEISARLAAFLADLGDGPAVIVSHGIALRVLRGLCLGLDVAGMEALPGGQGVVWRIRDGRHEVLETPMATDPGKNSPEAFGTA